MDRANKSHLNCPECIVAVFDLRGPNGAERLLREHAGWGDSANIEPLTTGHAALVIWPGGALGAHR
jgi:hypothetical protein